MRSFKTVSMWIVLTLATPVAADQGQGMNQGQGMGQGSGRGQGPPREAISACQGKSSGTSCSFTGMRGEQLQGTCMTPDSSRPLACCPPRGSRGGGGGSGNGGSI